MELLEFWCFGFGAWVFGMLRAWLRVKSVCWLFDWYAVYIAVVRDLGLLTSFVLTWIVASFGSCRVQAVFLGRCQTHPPSVLHLHLRPGYLSQGQRSTPISTLVLPTEYTGAFASLLHPTEGLLQLSCTIGALSPILLYTAQAPPTGNTPDNITTQPSTTCTRSR